MLAGSSTSLADTVNVSVVNSAIDLAPIAASSRVTLTSPTVIVIDLRIAEFAVPSLTAIVTA